MPLRLGQSAFKIEPVIAPDVNDDPMERAVAALEAIAASIARIDANLNNIAHTTTAIVRKMR